ncbi:MAG: hypothetical protein RL199_318 [Pseudomonadota bacterium]|jgi:hypothetical protein
MRKTRPWIPGAGVVLAAAGLMGCATVVLDGPEGIGSETPAGRERAVGSARAGRGLLSSPVPFMLDVAGGEESFQWSLPSVADTELTLERRAGLWVASGGVAVQAGRCATAWRETGTAEGPEADEALSRAVRQAARKLARRSVTAPEGRFSGSLVVAHRRIEAQGHRVRVTLEGCVDGARAEALGPVDACRLALAGLSRHSGETARWDGLAVRCPAFLGSEVAAARQRWLALDAAGRKALVDGFSSALEAGARAERPLPSASTSDSAGPVAAPSPAVRAAPSANAPIALNTVDVAPASAPSAPPPAVPAPVSVVVNVNGGPTSGASEGVTRVATAPKALRCPDGMVLFPSLTATGATEVDRKAFCLDRTEVTEKAYRGYGTRRPAASVSWRDADAYCRKSGWRLPKEAEWLRAMMGAGVRTHPWGEGAPTCERVNTNACEGTTRVVDAAGDVTPEGVFGLGGNVAEWSADGWGGDRPGARIVRGGAFTLPPSATSAEFRTGRDWNESYRDGGLGFRCASDPLPADAAASK